MNSPCIQLIAERKAGAHKRVWGWLTNGDHAYTFWRINPRSEFIFKASETYAGERTISEKVDEKLEEHGYREIPTVSLRYAALAGRISGEFQSGPRRLH